MWSAISGLGGVVIGGLLTMWSQYVLERRRERRQIRGIARLVHEEFSRAATEALFLEIYGPERQVTVGISVHDDVYREHRATLAQHLSAAEFSKLTSAASQRAIFMRYLDAKRDREDETLPFDDFMRRVMRDFLDECGRATQALGKAAGFSWWRRWKSRRVYARLLADHVKYAEKVD